MKDWQRLIGMIIIAVAIIICGILISQAIRDAGDNVCSALSYMGELLR